MAFENFIRAMEMLSVAPSFIAGSLGKMVYLRTISDRQRGGLDGERYLHETESILGGQSITPAGYYTGVWARDASFILAEMLEMGMRREVGTWLDWIWQNQIYVGQTQRLVFGRGSPDMGFRLTRAGDDDLKEFSGALPTSIQHGYNEVYAKSPDIDSTSLIVSLTCLFAMHGGANVTKFEPTIRKAIDAMKRKDVDNDGLLEQGPNEDWMDTMLRSGKIVYSQALWATALLNWSRLLEMLGKSADSEEALQGYKKVSRQVNSILWSEKKLCYVDRLDRPSSVVGENERTTNEFVTQDVASFLLLEEKGGPRVLQTLDALKDHLWTGLGPSCIAPHSAKTGPRNFGPKEYQNGGIWPWITSSEILARALHGRTEESQFLLKSVLPYSFLEWVHPEGISGGSYPFRTGIAATRTAIRYVSNQSRRSDRL